MASTKVLDRDTTIRNLCGIGIGQSTIGGAFHGWNDTVPTANGRDIPVWEVYGKAMAFVFKCSRVGTVPVRNRWGMVKPTMFRSGYRYDRFADAVQHVVATYTVRSGRAWFGNSLHEWDKKQGSTGGCERHPNDGTFSVKYRRPSDDGYGWVRCGKNDPGAVEDRIIVRRLSDVCPVNDPMEYADTADTIRAMNASDRRIIQARADGRTLADIGKECGMTEGGVRKALKRIARFAESLSDRIA